MEGVDREDDYDPRWPRLAGDAAGWALCAAFLGHQAVHPRPGDPPPLALIAWAGCAVSGAMLGVVGLLVAARCRVRHRLAFTGTALLVPRANWSAEEVAIDYRAITGLSVRDRGRFLR